MKTKPKTTKENKSNAAELFEKGRQIIREAAQAQPAAPAAVPDWVAEMPNEMMYRLDTIDPDGLVSQEVPLTRAEYIELKQHLATMRGLSPVPAAEPAATQPPESEAAPQYDLLRVHIYDLEKAQSAEFATIRERLLSRITKSLDELCVAHLQDVAQFADLCENSRGCITPAEDFIINLLRIHYESNGLIPDEVMDQFEGPDGFEANFEDAVDIAKRFHSMYPNTLNRPAA
jgi:hypothetical protein